MIQTVIMLIIEACTCDIVTIPFLSGSVAVQTSRLLDRSVGTASFYGPAKVMDPTPTHRRRRRMKSTGGSIPNLAQVGAAPLHGGTRPAFGFSAPFTAMAAWQQAALMAVIIIFTATLARIDLGVF